MTASRAVAMVSRRPTTRALGAAGKLALLVAIGPLPGLVRASDPVPVQQAPSSDSIMAAKHELDALKVEANSKASGVHDSALPSISLPQMDTAATSAPVVTSSTTSDPTKNRGRDPSNWLVDAMMNPRQGEGKGGRRKSRDARDSNDQTSRSRSSDRSQVTNETADDEETDVRANAAETTRADQKETAKDAANPLDQYLVQWLAPQDYTVLRHTLDSAESLRNNDGSYAAPPPPVTATDSASPLSFSGVDLGGDAPKPQVSAPPTDNPFLQFLSPPEPMPPAAPPPTAAPIFTPPSPPQPTAAPSPNSGVPDFVKPDTDDKYFKPLKRF